MNLRQRLAHRRRAHGDGGFTLVELLIVVMLLGMVTSALGASFVTAIRASSSTRDRINASNDAQLIASYLIRDAQATGGVNPTLALVDTTLGVSTNDAAGCGGGDVVVRFKWREYAPSTVTRVATWSYDSTEQTLDRTTCDGATTSTVTLAAHLDAEPTASCDPDCSGLPDTVSLQVTSPYAYTLTAAVRPEHQARPNGSNSSPAPLLALGGGQCTALSVTGTPGVIVYGDAFVNSADGTNCTAMGASGNISYTPGGQYIYDGGSCSGNRCPAFTSYDPPLTDPYGSLAPPSLASQPCPATNPPLVGGVHQPGIYGRALLLSSNATFAPGIYVFCAGISITGGTITDGDPGGVLFYVKGGTFSSSGNAAITLHGYADESSEYDGLLLWQPNATTVSIAGTADQTFDGAVYVPNALVSVSGNSGTKKLGSIVAQSIVFTGTSGICVGACPATPLSITAPASLPDSALNVAYPSTTFTATGGVGPYGWSATGLPAGMTMSAAGTISGTPRAAGTFNVTVTVTDGANFTANRAYTFSVSAPTITTSSLPAAVAGQAYSTTIGATGGAAPYDWTASGLPAGLSIDPMSGVLSGTPTTAGSFNVTATVTDATSTSDTRSYTLVVAPRLAVTGVQVVNGGTLGTIDKGDKIVVTFNNPIAVASMCSNWSGNTTNHSLGGTVRVTVTNGGAASDTLTVSSTGGGSCSFQFGTLNLGSAAWITTGSAEFSGNGNNASDAGYTYSPTNPTLTITLGRRASGTVPTGVAASTMTYTPSPSVSDIYGTTITPGAVSAGSQRF